MAMSAGSGEGIASTPNVTPMIDVMLVLLIIFMVVTPQLLAGFNADPPKAINLKDHPEDADNDHVLRIQRAFDVRSGGPGAEQHKRRPERRRVRSLSAGRRQAAVLEGAGRNGPR